MTCFNAARAVAILRAPGTWRRAYTVAEIAQKAGVSQGTIYALEKDNGRKIRSNVEPLDRLVWQHVLLPWTEAGDRQAFKMGSLSRDGQIGQLWDLYQFSGMEMVERAQQRVAVATPLSSTEWSNLLCAYVFLGGLSWTRVRWVEREFLLAAFDEVTDAILAALPPPNDISERWPMSSRRMSDQLLWADILRFDAICNRIAAKWDLGVGDSLLEDLTKSVSQLGYFNAFARFNNALPRCADAALNSVGIASATNRPELWEDLMRRLARADSKFANINAVLAHRDAGREFDNLKAAWKQGALDSWLTRDGRLRPVRRRVDA